MSDSVVRLPRTVNQTVQSKLALIIRLQVWAEAEEFETQSRTISKVEN
jgi:hypothetical protein